MSESNAKKWRVQVVNAEIVKLRKTVATWQSRANKFRKYLLELGYEVEVDLIEHGYEP